MFKNFVLIAIRQLVRNPVYSLINLFGLAAGLATCLLISYYVYDELTFDRIYNDSDRIYRVITMNSVPEQSSTGYAITSGALMLAIGEELPEVEAMTRIMPYGQVLLARKPNPNTKSQPDNILAFAGEVDSGFFDVFSYDVQGENTRDAFRKPDGCMLSKQIAFELFGDEDPVNRPLNFKGMPGAHVTGVFSKPPGNTHLNANTLITYFDTEDNSIWRNSWDNLIIFGYVKLKEHTDPVAFEEKMIALGRSHGFPEVFEPRLQPLTDIHLKSGDLVYDHINYGKNDSRRVLTLGLIAVLILIVASINFINLSTARAAKRAREIGMRKVLGAQNSQLVTQFLGESVFLSLTAMVLAMGMIELFMPTVSRFMSKMMEWNFFEKPVTILVLVLIAVIVGLASGIYPSLILARYRPANVLKGNFGTNRQGVRLRQVLVLFQFAVSIALIIGVLTVLGQIQYMKNKDLGFNRDNVVVLPTIGESESNSGKATLLNRLRESPGILSVGTARNIPGSSAEIPRYEVIGEGAVNQEHGIMFQNCGMDEHLIDLLHINLIEGRNFNAGSASDSLESVMINRTARNMYGWDQAVGKSLKIVDVDGVRRPRQVIGVIEDFHLGSIHQAIEPMIATFMPSGGSYIAVRIDPENELAATKAIKEIWIDVFPERKFSSYFLDDIFDGQFIADRHFATSMAIFAGLGIFIACLGLFGLTSYTTVQRRQEIAVRKVLGSGERQIVFMLTSDFLRWVILANLIAWPLGYFGMHLWLKDFVYQVSPTILPYLYAGFGALFIALATIAFQSIRAARTNPAIALRQET